MTTTKRVDPQNPNVFNDLAGRYDFLNRLLSARQDVQWRRLLSSQINPEKPIKVLDVATGTADVALTLLKEHKMIEMCTGVDPAENMLAIGQKKLEKAGQDHRCTLQIGDAQDLKFEDKTFDVATISFGIRNVPDYKKGLSEIYRVLKPGGQFLVLEFSIPGYPLKPFYLGYFRHVLPVIGRVLSGHPTAYKYLNKSSEGFPYGKDFVNEMEAVGFNSVSFQPLSMGIVTLYKGQK